MLTGGGGRIGQECAHSALLNHPLGFIGRGKILAQSLWPGMETRLRRATGQLEGFSTEAVDADGTYQSRDALLRQAILNRGRFGRDGLTVEGVVENLILDEDFSAWTLRNGMTAGDITLGQADPAGGALGYRLRDNDATKFEALRATGLTGLADDNTVYTMSVFILKDSDTSRFPEIECYLSGGSSAVTRHVQINTSTGQTLVRVTTGTVSHSLVSWDSTWWLYTVTLTNNTSGHSQIIWELLPAITATFGVLEATATGSITVAFPFAARIAFAPNYIHTTGAAVTKAAEDLRLDNTSEVICKAAQGSMLFAVVPEFNEDELAGNDIHILDARTSDNNDGLRLYFDDAAGNLMVQVSSGGSNVANLSGAAGRPVRGTIQVPAVSWGLNDFALYNDGVLLDSDILGAAPTVMNASLFIGQDMINERQMFGQLGMAIITERSLTARQVENSTAVIGKAA